MQSTSAGILELTGIQTHAATAQQPNHVQQPHPNQQQQHIAQQHPQHEAHQPHEVTAPRRKEHRYYQKKRPLKLRGLFNIIQIIT
ncbi:hypothetical protein CS542_00955 [Pedobacter sp. IW39]|nr:hypothetical protein CS542_00955 [Pedobacter sp. IW39]